MARRGINPENTQGNRGDSSKGTRIEGKRCHTRGTKSASGAVAKGS